MDKKEEKAIKRSKVQINCFAQAALTIDTLHGRSKLLDVPTVMQGLIDGAQKITEGNTKEIEQMLFTHVKTLDYVFYDALSQLTDCQMINQIEVYANIAFRAQNQSRKALLALAELKNPRRATFIKQQNNAINQQINSSSQEQVKNFKNSNKFANELLKEADRETLDCRGTPETGSINPKMETLEPIYRSKDTKG
ncbi:TPA: hypothetical protein JAN90_04490 [Legionella pneumophila]|nr:hypothetical protein [Legionella pneumophila]HAT8869209.1 hypothetical protein [Legionella pneumophila subsp. pneumophila]HAT7072034.1 hypothetical protein [Legionella pneumophila]HAT8642970.1 hypothetical protein [Legionella pneumophila]HAT8891270.1 hypothetical protein [Legionella pneumophila subsp. pneumophila]HAT8932213.1 hypothetical protein [Legionella pneumophila subsp. pneumophila]